MQAESAPIDHLRLPIPYRVFDHAAEKTIRLAQTDADFTDSVI